MDPDLVADRRSEISRRADRVGGAPRGAQRGVRDGDVICRCARGRLDGKVVGGNLDPRFSRGGTVRLLGAEDVFSVERRPVHLEEPATAAGCSPAGPGLKLGCGARRIARRRAGVNSDPTTVHRGAGVAEASSQVDPDGSARATDKAVAILQRDGHGPHAVCPHLSRRVKAGTERNRHPRAARMTARGMQPTAVGRQWCAGRAAGHVRRTFSAGNVDGLLLAGTKRAAELCRPVKLSVIVEGRAVAVAVDLDLRPGNRAVPKILQVEIPLPHAPARCACVDVVDSRVNPSRLNCHLVGLKPALPELRGSRLGD